MHTDPDHAEALQPLADDGWITEVLYEVKSGKEATVFCCRGGDRSPDPLVAAKVYRPLETRRFKNDAMYLQGRVHLARSGRVQRAAMGNSSFGRQVRYGTWLHEEWETLSILYDGGVSVPRPIVAGERALLLAFLGDDTAPAPMLHAWTPPPGAAERVIEDVLRDVECMLHHDCVHGDLSPYNVMVADGRPVLIDFPQSVDPRLNANAFTLLARDIDRVCAWGARHGAPRDAGRISADLWRRFTMGEIG